ncbi:CHAT domain-containing protein [Sulfidibacter corallicola]|uniref:CHAT domain-containing protein n=1 Tax=Sulfidibacter corallicola TaxID=2818388 RepID=A0A8A4TPR5_SULCO|nr:CHAT domain-containing protein [Sulfidibacter corallicola]QTD51427.1 CHAT domain-containing protein [Sulfidibacter corallicola]
MNCGEMVSPRFEVDPNRLEVEIEPQENGEYQLSITWFATHPERAATRVFLDWDRLNRLRADPAAYGRSLGMFLFDPVLLQFWRRACDTGTPFRFSPVISDSRLLTLHWHWLQVPSAEACRAVPMSLSDRDPERVDSLDDVPALEEAYREPGAWRFLSLYEKIHFSIRIPTSRQGPAEQLNRGAFKMLLVVASPPENDRGGESFDTAKMIQGIVNEQQPYEVEILEYPNEKDHGPPHLDRISKQLSLGGHSVLHLVAHGRHDAKKRRTFLYLAKEGGGMEWIEDRDFIGMLAHLAIKPHLVVLSSCGSADGGLPIDLDAGSPEPFVGLGARLVRDLGIPWVVAMKGALYLDIAHNLHRVFYRFLLRYGRVDAAFSKIFAGFGDHEARLAPVVMSRTTEPLFRGDREVVSRHEWNHGLHRLWPILASRVPERTLRTLRERCHAHQNRRFDGDRWAQAPIVADLTTYYRLVFGGSFADFARGEDAPPDLVSGNPFLGMRAFDIHDACRFCGREAEVAELVARLQKDPVLLISGVSGSGKSSLVGGGLLPALQSLFPELGILVIEPGEDWREDLAQLEIHPDVVLVLDHLERLSADEWNQKDAAAWLHDLLHLASRSPGRRRFLVAVVREDCLGWILSLEDKARSLSRNLSIVRPLRDQRLMRAMTQQAAASGLRVEDRLVESLVVEIAGHDSCMPLVQFLFNQLVERRHGPWLRFEEYVELGRLSGVIAKHADAAVSLVSGTDQDLLEFIFSRLVDVDEFEDREPKRFVLRRAAIAILIPEMVSLSEVKPLIEMLRERRILVHYPDETVVLIHEAIVRRWPWLKAVLWDRNKLFESLEGLGPRIRHWEEEGRTRGATPAFTTELRLIQELADGKRFALNRAERDFLDASREASEREEQRKQQYVEDLRNAKRRWRTMAKGLIAVSVFLLAMMVVTWGEIKERHVAQVLQLTQRARSESEEGHYYQAGILALEALALAESWLPLPRVPEAEAELYRAMAAFEPMVHLAQHDEDVLGLATDDSGDWGVSWSKKRLFLWTPRGESTKTLEAEEGRSFLDAAFLPGGQKVAVVLSDGLAVVYTLPEMTELFRLECGRKKLSNLGFSTDGRLIATASEDGALKVWDAHDGALMGTWTHDFSLTHVLLVADGGTAVFSDRASGLYLWDWRAGAAPETLREPRSAKGTRRLRHLAYRPAAHNLLYLDGKNQLWRQKLEPGFDPEIIERGVNLFRFDRRSDLLAVLRQGYDLFIKGSGEAEFSTQAEKRFTTRKATIGLTNDLAFCSEEQVLATLFKQRALKIRHLWSGTIVFETPPDLEPRRFEFCGKALIVADAMGRVIAFPRPKSRFCAYTDQAGATAQEGASQSVEPEPIDPIWLTHAGYFKGESTRAPEESGEGARSTEARGMSVRREGNMARPSDRKWRRRLQKFGFNPSEANRFKIARDGQSCTVFGENGETLFYRAERGLSGVPVAIEVPSPHFDADFPNQREFVLRDPSGIVTHARIVDTQELIRRARLVFKPSEREMPDEVPDEEVPDEDTHKK